MPKRTICIITSGHPGGNAVGKGNESLVISLLESSPFHSPVSVGGNPSAFGRVPWHTHSVPGFLGVLAQTRNLLGLAGDVHCFLPSRPGLLELRL